MGNRATIPNAIRALVYAGVALAFGIVGVALAKAAKANGILEKPFEKVTFSSAFFWQIGMITTFSEEN